VRPKRSAEKEKGFWGRRPLVTQGQGGGRGEQSQSGACEKLIYPQTGGKIRREKKLFREGRIEPGKETQKKRPGGK